MRIVHVGDQRNAAGPEARVLLGAGNVLAELGREFAVHGGDVDADLLEDAPMHQRHGAAAAIRAGMVGALPRRFLEAAGRPVAEHGLVWQFVLDRLEFGDDAVTQFREPCGGAGLLVFDVGRDHGMSRRSGGQARVI